MKLHPLLHTICLLLLCSLLVVYLLLDRHFEQQLIADLQQNLQERKQQLHEYYQSQTQLAQAYANTPESQAFARQLLRLSPAGRLQPEVKNKIREYFLPVITAQGLQGFFIIAPNGISLASARDHNTGTENLLAARQPALFQHVLEGHAAVSAPLESDTPLMDDAGRYRNNLPTMFSLAPIQENGKTIALLALRLNPLDARQSILNQLHMHYPGECFLLSDSGYFLSARVNDTHNNPMSPLQRGLNLLRISSRTPAGLANVMTSAVAKHNNGMNIDGYEDYRGIPVVGIWQWDKKLQAALVIEIQYQHAFHNRHITQIACLIIMLFIGLLWLSILWLLKKINQQKNHNNNPPHTRHLLQHLPLGAIGFNASGNVEFINRCGSEMLGYHHADINSQNLVYLLTHTSPRKKHYTLDLGLKNMIPQKNISDVFSRADHTEMAVVYSLMLLPDAIPFHGLLLFYPEKPAPLSAPNANEPAIFNAQPLKQLIGSLAPMFNHMLGYVQIATQEQHKTERDEVLAELKNSIQLASQNMDYHLKHFLLQHGLLSSEISAGNIFSLQNNLLENFKLSLNEKKAYLFLNTDPALPVSLHCDHPHLSLVIQHLLCHCLRFTHEGAIEINFNGNFSDPQQPRLHVSVQSTDSGIPENLLNIAMSPNINEHSREQGDLWFCQALISLMKGEFNLENDESIGTRIWFSIPIGVHDTRCLRDLIPQQMQNTSVLVIMKNALLRSWVNNTLLSWGIHTDDNLAGKNNIEYLISDDAALAGQFPYNSLYIGKEKTQTSALQAPITQLQLCESIKKWFLEDTATQPKLQTRNKCILLVEDNEINREVACGLLEIIGVDVVVAENGALALEKLKQHKIDLILMDIQMPVMDGLSATRQIRSMPEYADLPIIALSAQNSAQDVEISLQAGMNQHICKPINIQTLEKTLAQWLDDN